MKEPHSSVHSLKHPQSQIGKLFENVLVKEYVKTIITLGRLFEYSVQEGATAAESPQKLFPHILHKCSLIKIFFLGDLPNIQFRRVQNKKEEEENSISKKKGKRKKRLSQSIPFIQKWMKHATFVNYIFIIYTF